MIAFDRVVNRYVLDCHLTSTANLHIGTGIASGDSDAPFIRRAGAVFIPGSSLRGVLRSRVERIVSSIAPPGMPACISFEPGPADGCVCGNKGLRESYEAKEGRVLLAAIRAGDVKMCAICQLFGSTLMASRLKVSDAMPSKHRHEPRRRDGVGINRDTETAQPGVKFDFEVLEPAVEFKVTLELENAEDSDLALLHIALIELRAGLEVGGKKSRGLGRMVLTKVDVKYFDAALHRPAQLLKPLPDCPDFWTKLEQCFNRVFDGGKANADARN
jgi:CRISPR-associated protein Csm3